MGIQETYSRTKNGAYDIDFCTMFSKKLTPIHYKTLIRIFEFDGFVVKRKKGDHIIMTKSGVKRPIVIKTSSGVVPVTHIRTNMTTAGITRERFFEILEKIKE
ncbi:hypothetical protein ES705_33849 [subsurface metagenome]